ncbi:MAG: hypothetical protein H6618_07385 [Deltaproteobacteria bacterium]|nr:hypothetical protein [Deltaproteobacteria bacterium]
MKDSERKKRKLRNYFLQPLLQIRLGLYSILLTILFSATIMMILYLNLEDFTTILLALTDSESEIRELFSEYISQTIWWVLILVLIFIITSISVSVVYTHKLVGPTIAFRSQIEKLRHGEFQSRITLRKGDGFQEVADEINLLTEILRKNNGTIPIGIKNTKTAPFSEQQQSGDKSPISS